VTNGADRYRAAALVGGPCDWWNDVVFLGCRGSPGLAADLLPVLNEAYATRIAREWNTKDGANGNVGYVLRFDVDTAYLSRFETHQIGDDECVEYWIPAEELDSFNDHIRDEIEVVSEWRGTQDAV